MSKHTNQEKETKRKRWMLAIMIVLLLLLISSCSVAIWSIFFRDTTPTLAPDYAPQEIEPNATPMPDTGKDKLEQSSGGGAVSLEYTTEVTIDLSDRKARFSFANPEESNQDMVLQLVIQDEVILQTGLLPPGHSVQQANIFDHIRLSPGGYDGKFVVLYYYESGEKAMVKTDIPLTVIVKE